MIHRRIAIAVLATIVIATAGTPNRAARGGEEAPRARTTTAEDEARIRSAKIIGRWRPSQNGGDKVLVFRPDGTGTNYDGSRFVWAFEGRHLRARPEGAPDEKESLIAIRFTRDFNTYQLALQFGAMQVEFERLDDEGKPLGHREPAGGQFVDEPVVIPNLPTSVDVRKSNGRLAVHVDASEAPELRGWADEVATMMKGGYVKALSALGMVAPKPALEINLVIKKGDLPGAQTESRTITIYSPWADKHKDEKSVGIHELVHVLVRHNSGAPQWLVEGIPDYVRYFIVEPGTLPEFEPRNYEYTNGYVPTAAMLDWIERTNGPGVVARLSLSVRDGTYSDALFEKLAGCGPGEAWRRFVAFKLGHGADGKAK